MPEKDINQAPENAQVFFDKANEAAQSGRYDQAIKFYIEALRISPDEVEKGHIKLRELAATRQSKGGQKPTKADVQQHLKGNTPLERMLNAEYLLAMNPVHMPYAEAMLKAAVEGGYKRTAKWVADMIFLANNRAKKPSVRLYLILKDAYAAIGRIDRAIAACEAAAKSRPQDKALEEELDELYHKRAVEQGRRQDEQLDLTVTTAAREPKPDRNLAATGTRATLTQEQPDPALARARDLFSKARQVAETNDFDYAIDLYLQGLRHQPDALEEGHLPLCETALRRQKTGGKKPSMVERVKRLTGKSALDQMLNAEYLFAKDPSHLPYAGQMLKAAIAADCKRTANWIANYIFQENNTATKPSFRIYTLLKDCYKQLGQFDKALAACQRAAQLKPQDADLADELKNLTAEMTVARGRYDQDGDFRKSIKDRELQEKIYAQERVIKTRDFRKAMVQDARKALSRDPDLPQNIFNLASALAQLDEDEAENEAIELLERTAKRKNDFSYAQRAGQIRIKQLKRKIKEAKESLEADPGDVGAKALLEKLSDRLNEVELEHYRKCVKNYPTDLQAKYEYATRLFRNQRYDQAIPLFQESQRDPRHKISSMDKIGQCFFMKGWYADAVDVFNQAIQAHEAKDDKIAKELRYNLARAYEQQGQTEQALEVYRKIAQLDFGFKDVRERVDKLRSRME